MPRIEKQNTKQSLEAGVPVSYFFPVVLSTIGILLLSVFMTSTFADSSLQSINISNSTPTIDTIYVTTASGGANIASFVPAEGINKTMYVRGTASDDNGCRQIDTPEQWTLNIFRSNLALGFGCSADNSNCFHDPVGANVILSGCNGVGDLDINYEFTMVLPHYLDATDTGPFAGTDWKARARLMDDFGAFAVSTASFEIASVRALDVDPGIDYGPLTLGATSEQRTLEVRNTGNREMDVFIKASGDLTCTQGTIPASNVHMSLTNGFAYNSHLKAIGTIDDAVDISLAKRAAQPAAQNFHFKIKVPDSGVGGVCSNIMTFTAKEDI